MTATATSTPTDRPAGHPGCASSSPSGRSCARCAPPSSRCWPPWWPSSASRSWSPRSPSRTGRRPTPVSSRRSTRRAQPRRPVHRPARDRRPRRPADHRRVRHRQHPLDLRRRPASASRAVGQVRRLQRHDAGDPGAVLPGRLLHRAVDLHQQASRDDLRAPNVARAVIGSALYLTVVGLLGLGSARLLRNTAAGISTLFGVLFVLPIIVHFLPSSWSDPDRQATSRPAPGRTSPPWCRTAARWPRGPASPSSAATPPWCSPSRPCA